MPLVPGVRLGPYEVVSPLGTGGMGEVYKARDTRLDRDVAIKVMSAATAGDPILGQRLLREARAASALNHPHICTIHDVGDAEGRPFIAMEWIDGESLADRLRALGAGGLGLDETLRLASQMADALDAAHTSGIIHRDLKPANLFITKRGDAKILDFGLAKVTNVAQRLGAARAGNPDRLRQGYGGATKLQAAEGLGDNPADQATQAADSNLTSPGAAVGTVAYMSPEQARGEPLAPTSDLFSFGVVLYEMATGKAAFAGPTTAVTFDAILNRQPAAARDVQPKVPAALEQIINRLLAKQPSGRYQSARVVREELEALRQTFQRDRSSGSTRIAPSIAVLPFTNLSPEPENEYIADGITEEIINTLAQIKGLQVAARTSSFAFKGKTPDLTDVAAKLHVAHVLTGSVRKAGPRLRITAQLVNAHDGFPIWSERYDRQADDIFEIQDEIATAIAQKLRVALTGPTDEPLVRRPTDNLDAYELYLRGRFHINQRGAALQKAMDCFAEALTLDPQYALAHAGIATAAALLGFYGYRPGYETMPEARRAALNAIDLDPTLAEPHAPLMLVLWLYDWDWHRAEQEFARTIELDGRSSSAYIWHALHLACVHGRFEEALRVGRRSSEVDPLSSAALASLAAVCVYAGRLDEAVATAQRALELDSQMWNGERFLGVALRHLGRTEEAIAHLQRAATVSNRHPWTLQELAQTLFIAGRKREATPLCEEIIERARTGYVAPIIVAHMHALMGDADEAFEWLERGYRERDAFPVWRHWPYSIGADPARAAAIFRRMGLG